MIDFLIFYEVKKREFECIVLLGHELKKRGYTVEYVSFYQLNDFKLRKKFFNKVKVAVMPSLYHDNELIRYVYAFAGQVKQIVNLRWEQVYTKEVERDVNSYTMPKGVVQEAIHCNWGKKPQEMLLAAGITLDKLPITGPMHMDLVHSNFDKLYLTKDELYEKYSISKDKKCILFISSYALATQTERQIEQYINEIGSEKREHIKKRIDNMRRSYCATLEWLGAYVEANDCTVIYRPHPAENRTMELEMLDSKSNIYIIGEENVKQWIKCCDLVYTWVSTSIAEAYFANKKCAILRPLPLDDNIDMSIYDNARFITEKTEFINSYYDVQDKMYIDGKVIEDYYEQNEGCFSYIRTANVLEQVLKQDVSFPWEKLSSKIKKQMIKLTIHLWLFKPYRFLLKIMGVLKKIGIKLPSFLNSRVENMMKEQNNGRIITEEEFQWMERKLRNIMEGCQ